MVQDQLNPLDLQKYTLIAIAWCLAWGDQQEPKFGLSVLKTMRLAMLY
ncbi:MAG: hypothetical protein SFY66_00500 [Oculatellaceae cyanobacterium bins.114]|nr:hypothetical protein [Oculatellaceae cyanobacterium bins.114]